MPRVGQLSLLWKWKFKKLKLNLMHTTHKKVNLAMSIHETMNQSRI